MEYLDIRDKNGNPTGVIKERSLVHADGDLHGCLLYTSKPAEKPDKKTVKAKKVVVNKKCIVLKKGKKVKLKAKLKPANARCV